MGRIITREDLGVQKIFLVITPPSAIRAENSKIVSQLSDLGFHTVIVTINFPHSVLVKLYREAGVDEKNLTFIDAVTRHAIGSVKDVPGVVRYVRNPGDLTDMGIAITETIRELSGKKVCLLYDSVSTMLIYQSSHDISRFIHFVTSKLRLLDISGIFLAAEKGLDPNLLSSLRVFVDEVIDNE